MRRRTVWGIEDTAHKALELPTPRKTLLELQMLNNVNVLLSEAQSRTTYQCVIVHPLVCMYAPTPLNPAIKSAPQNTSLSFKIGFFRISLRSRNAQIKKGRNHSIAGINPENRRRIRKSRQ